MATKTEMELFNKIVRDIDAAGGVVYYVGGYVRDKFIGKVSKDIDVEIHNITVDTVKTILSKYGKLDLVGKAFGILKLRGVDIDFAFPRLEFQAGVKHTDFEVRVDPFMGARKAASRRDFTMNSIMENVLTGEIIDPYFGREAIATRSIELIDAKSYAEDPLRALRAAQFAARFDFTVDSEVIEVSKGLDYTHLSVERVETELNKILLSDRPSVGLHYLKEMGVLTQLSPILDQLSGVPQNPEYHPEGDVFEHTKIVVDAASKLKSASVDPLAFMYLALTHDIGKLTTTAVNEKTGKLQAIGHEQAGVDLVEDCLRSLTKRTSLLKYLKPMIEYHMVGHTILERRPINVRRLLRKVDMAEVLLFNCADQARKVGMAADELKAGANYEEKVNFVRSFEMGAAFQIVPVINGGDLIKLGVEPGPVFKSLLEEAIEFQMQGASREKILRTLAKKAKKLKS